jgi:hypothetical protein
VQATAAQIAQFCGAFAIYNARPESRPERRIFRAGSGPLQATERDRFGGPRGTASPVMCLT